MVAAPLATVSVEVKLPGAKAAPAPTPQKPVFISLQKTGAVYVGDYQSSLGRLSADIKKQIPNRDPTNERIFIRADSDVLYQEFMRVLAVLQDNEFYSVALVGEDKNTPQ
jgi:biopolymer transport protein ExbD